MPTISALTTFTANTQAKAAEVNANFSAIRTTVNTYGAFVDLAATITGAWTFATAPTISGAMTFGAAVTITTGGLTVSAGGVTVTGTSTITGTLTVSSTLTAATFSGSGASLTNLPAANLTGTLPAISGANLTSLNGSNIASGTVSQDRLPTSYAGLTSSSSVTLTGGAITFNQTTSTPNALSFGLGATHVTQGSGSVPAFGSTAPAAGVSWQWIRCAYAGGTAYIPMLTV